MLHLGPDEVVARIRHRAVDLWVGGVENRPAGHFAALHHLQLYRIPDLAAGGRIERTAVLPRVGAERALVDAALQRRGERAAVLACGRCERGLRGPRGGVVGVRISRGGRGSALSCRRRWLRGSALSRWWILSLRFKRGDSQRCDN